jgi:hypothetical protein
LTVACASPTTSPKANQPKDPAPPDGQAQVSRLQDRAALALRGPQVEAKGGDFVLASDGVIAVVSAESGALLDFAPEGGFDEIVAITPALFDGPSPIRTALIAISSPPARPGVLHVEQRPAYLPVTLHTYYTFRNQVLVIDSLVTPDSTAAEGMAIGLGERIGWGNAPTWLEGRGFLRNSGGTFSTKFLGRQGKELSYVVSFGDEASMVRVGHPFLPGYFGQARGSELTFASSSSGFRRTLFLATSSGSIGSTAAKLYQPNSFQVAEPPKLPPGGTVEVASCATESEPRKPFARFARGDKLEAPVGCYEGKLWAPGSPEGTWTSFEEVSKATLLPSGRVSVVASERGKPIPVRVQFRGLGTTKDPDWGEDPDNGAALNVAYAPTGVASHKLPPGEYRVIVDRGIEYTAVDRTITVVANQRSHVSAELERVVDTVGWISSDLHLHAAPSPDAPQTLEDRVISLAAAGVEVGVATDHNRVTDYKPAIQALGLESEVNTIIGVEVTTEDSLFGHFNVFPLLPTTAPLRYKHTNPLELLVEAKQQQPYGPLTIAQINHPRMGDIGYFDMARFDREDVVGFRRRNPAIPLNFDTIEVFNGDDLSAIGNVQSVMKDWIALERAGIPLTATGNSDSHRAVFHEPGLPRTYVRMNDDAPQAFGEREFIESLHARAVTVTSGPFIRFEIDGKGPGQRVPPGKHRVRIQVDAAPYVDVSLLELVNSGKVVATSNAPFPKGAHRAELEADVEVAAGDSLIAVASGSKEVEIAFRRGVMPFAFTNPIVVSAFERPVGQ